MASNAAPSMFRARMENENLHSSVAARMQPSARWQRSRGSIPPLMGAEETSHLSLWQIGTIQRKPQERQFRNPATLHFSLASGLRKTIPLAKALRAGAPHQIGPD